MDRDGDDGLVLLFRVYYDTTAVTVVGPVLGDIVGMCVMPERRLLVNSNHGLCVLNERLEFVPWKLEGNCHLRAQ